MEKSSTNGTLVARSTGDRTEAQDLCGTNQGSTRSAERSKENGNTKGKAKPDSAARTGPDSELCHAVLGTRTKTEKKIMCNKKIAWTRRQKWKMRNWEWPAGKQTQTKNQLRASMTFLNQRKTKGDPVQIKRKMNSTLGM
jgi:hypothetical protein